MGYARRQTIRLLKTIVIHLLRNDPKILWIADTEVQENITQALKYAKDDPEGVEWVTNSFDFVKTYAKLFTAAGIEKFHFTIIPAVRR